ncbi:hypothetical protein IFM89_002569 [Coptis chinensis]|uniref:Telomerase reverse transcriptase n=1 Tax=Coptis chinensis TaxID=261450 RepID=A0A835HJF0_9MAGN|nr:hypothetical protein IFM89_002569 [Coptis chinensis]
MVIGSKVKQRPKLAMLKREEKNNASGLLEIFHSLRKLLKCLLHKVRICHHSKLMDKHYTVEALEMSTMGEAEPMLKKDCIQPLENSSLHVNLLQQKLCQRSSRAFDHNFKHGRYCLKSQVVSFIWNVCRSIVPLELVGAPSNWRALRRNISKFVHLRKFENFSLKQCMHGLKTSCVPLLSNWYSSCYMNNHAPETGEKLINDYQKFSEVMAILKNNLFSYWIYWLFSRLVVPIVQSSFYVTEVEGGKLDMFYYRKPTWEKMSSKGVTCLREQNYRLLSDKSLSSILRKNSFGFSKVRFCPKENGMRVLANLKASSKFPIRSHLQKSSHNTQSCFKPVNDVLRDLGAVLKGLKMKNPEKLGSSVFNYNDVYKKLCPFLSGLKSRSSTVPSVYIVICDISKAFDSVNQDKLLSVMKDVMLNEEYLLQFSSEVVCTKKCLWVHYGQKLLDPTMGTATMKSAPSVPFRVLHRVLTNQETSKMVWKAQLYQDLYQHVKWNMLLLEKQFYLQEVGIPQGSAVSSLLCSYYYAHMERNVIFPFLEKIQEPHTSKSAKTNLSGELICQSNGPTEKDEEQNTPTGPEHALLRFIDDFLFISTSKEQATSFFTRLQRGFRDYSCFINESKSCMNFDLGELSGLPSKKMYMGDDGISFLPWSGLLINFCTLEIQADYTRYLNIHVSSTLTVQWQNKPSCYLKDKLCSYLQPKCHPIFYDSNINSAATVRLNIYQAFLLCSMKFHCYVCNLSKVCTLQAEQYYEMIMSSLRYMHRLIRRRIFTVNGTGVHPVLHLKKIEVLWLGLKAYIRVLEKKQPRHSRLLYLLRSEMLGFLEVESASLRYATDDSHSSLFWKIKY